MDIGNLSEKIGKFPFERSEKVLTSGEHCVGLQIIMAGSVILNDESLSWGFRVDEVQGKEIIDFGDRRQKSFAC